MKSASQMSLEIRRKKKAMQDDPGVVDLSGIPMDKTDEDLMEQDSMTKDMGLDTNEPAPRSAHQDLMADSHARKMAEGGEVLPKHMHPPKDVELEAIPRLPMAEGGEMDEAAQKRKSRLAKMMSR